MTIDLYQEPSTGKWIIVENLRWKDTAGIDGTLDGGAGYLGHDRMWGGDRWLSNGPLNLRFDTSEEAEAYLKANEAKMRQMQ